MGQQGYNRQWAQHPEGEWRQHGGRRGGQWGGQWGGPWGQWGGGFRGYAEATCAPRSST